MERDGVYWPCTSSCPPRLPVGVPRLSNSKSLGRRFFSNILNLNFIPLYSCLIPVSVLDCRYIMTIDISFWDTFSYKKEFKFLNWVFLLRNCKILSVFQSTVRSLNSDSFRIRNYPDSEWFFPDPYPEPAKIFGCDRIRIHNMYETLVFISPFTICVVCLQIASVAGATIRTPHIAEPWQRGPCHCLPWLCRQHIRGRYQVPCNSFLN